MCVMRIQDSRGHPGTVFANSAMNEVVLFEIPDSEDATQLCQLLAMDWFTWVQSHDTLRFVAVMLLPEEADLAVLLRTVQRWIAGRGLHKVRFELDGRRYALDTRKAASAPLAA
jgi:hypothetical protein